MMIKNEREEKKYDNEANWEREKKSEKGREKKRLVENINKENTINSSSFLFINIDDKKKKENGNGNENGTNWEEKKIEKRREKKETCEKYIYEENTTTPFVLVINIDDKNERESEKKNI